MAIFSDREALESRQEEMKQRQERKNEAKKLAKRKHFSTLKSTTYAKKKLTKFSSVI
jgi:hypothetical protein